MTDRTSAHPDLEELKAFALGRMDLDRMAEVETHLATCDSCCRSIQVLPEDGFVALLRMAAEPPMAGRGGEGTSIPGEGGVGLEIPSSFVLTGVSPAEDPTGAMPDPARPVSPEVLADLAEHPRYRIVRWLGAGGMGTVYLAEHRLMRRPVALKVIGRDLMGHADLVERFRREVQAAARLSHPNIVAAFDAEQAGATHLLVMEFVEGTDLARRVKAQGPLPVAEACDCARQVALGLQHAHEHGMVHRDIKPQNLIQTPRGQVKILDFGLARFASEVGPNASMTSSGTVLTSSGTVVGTADYIAPEQADDSHAADIRADIYSLGCTLYFLLTGHPPFPGGTLMQKLLAHAREAPRSLASIRADLPHDLGQVLDRMMAKDPARRYQTPAEVARALAPFAEASALPATIEMSRPSPTIDTAVAHRTVLPAARSSDDRKAGAADLGPSALAEPGPTRRSRRFWTVVATLLLGAGLLALVVYRIRTDRGELVIETDDPDVEVVVKQDGKLVTIIDPETDQRVELQSGEYQVALNGKPKGLQLSTNTFTLKRGAREIVRVRKVPPAQVPPATLSSGDGMGRPPAILREVLRCVGHAERVWSVAITPDGRRALSGGEDRTLRLWNLSDGVEVRRFEVGTGSVYSVALSPDGRRALSASDDGLVRLWDVESGRELRRFEGHTDRVNSVAFSPDGRHVLSGSYDETVRLWETEGGLEVRRFEGHSGHINAVAFSPDGRQVLAGSGLTILLWDVASGRELRRFDGQQGVACLAFAPDGRRILSGSYDGTVRLWDVASGRELRRFAWVQGSHVNSVAFAPDGRRALAGSSVGDDRVRLWDVDTGAMIASYEGHAGGVTCVAFAPDGRRALSSGNDKTVRLLELPDAALAVRRFEGHTGPVRKVVFSPDGRLALSGSGYPYGDNTVRLWDVASGRPMRVFHQDGMNWVLSVAFSPDGRRALSGGFDRVIRLWDLASGLELRRLEGHEAQVEGVTFSPDGRRALSGAGDATMRLWDVETGRELRRVQVPGEKVTDVAFSPDGRRALSAGSDGTVRLWDVETGRELRRFEGHADWVWSVAISPDGLLGISGGGGEFREGRWEAGGDFALRLWALPLADQDRPPSAFLDRTAGRVGRPD